MLACRCTGNQLVPGFLGDIPVCGAASVAARCVDRSCAQHCCGGRSFTSERVDLQPLSCLCAGVFRHLFRTHGCLFTSHLCDLACLHLHGVGCGHGGNP